jgi:TolB protein
MDGDGTNVRRLTENGHMDNFPALSPDGRRIVFESNRLRAHGEPVNTSHLFLMNTDGSAQTPLVRGNSATWSPDGRRIVYCCRKGDPEREGGPGSFEICVMNADGTGQARLTNNKIGDLTPTWSPDGTRIMFHRRVGGRGQFQLFVINADGTGEKQMTNPPGLSGFPNCGEVRGRARRSSKPTPADYRSWRALTFGARTDRFVIERGG